MVKKGLENEFLQTGPSQFINEEGVLDKSSQYISQYGDRVLISGGVRALRSLDNRLTESLDKQEISWRKHTFIGECSDSNIQKIFDKIKEFSAEVLIGVGGGKSLDAAKVAADKAEIPIITLPTIAATCAAMSALSVVYNDKGEYEKDYYLPKCPDLVLIEPEIIAKAPVKYLRSGIIDALAKWYEGRTAVQGIENPDIFSISAVTLAEKLNDRMEQHVLKAVESAEKDKLGAALKEIINLNIYLTGVIQNVGQLTCRGAAAHAVSNGLSVIEASHDLLHGEKVAYGIIVQLFLENLPETEIDETITFFEEIGLKPSLKNYNLPTDSEIIKKVANKACQDYVMGKMPFAVSPEMVVAAIDKAEEKMETV